MLKLLLLLCFFFPGAFIIYIVAEGILLTKVSLVFFFVF